MLDVSTSYETRRLNKLKKRKLKRCRKDEKDSLCLYQPNEKGVTQFDVTEQIDRQVARRRKVLNEGAVEGQLEDIVNFSLQTYKQLLFTEQAWQ